MESLNAPQAAALQQAFHSGAKEASRALAKWLGKPAVVEVDALEQLALSEATSVLGTGEDPICFCWAGMQGMLCGELILAFEDASGWKLADVLLEQPEGTTSEWTELARSAVLETTNILCCAYLNSLSRKLSKGDESYELLPSPPEFRRDFAESLMEFALMGQAATGDQMIFTKTRFAINHSPVQWTLLFVPESPSMARLSQLLAQRDAPGEEC